MQDPQTEILRIGINATGVSHLFRLYRIVRVAFLITIVGSFIPIINGIIAIWNAPKYSTAYFEFPFLRYYYQFYPFVWLFQILVWIAEIYFFWRFSSMIKKALIDMNEEKFNESFVQICTNARLLVISVILGLILNVAYLYIQINYPVIG